MIARTVTIAAMAAALGLSACPAEATGPWGIIANGTQLNGLALQRVTSGSIRLQERDEDEPNCEEWICGANGTSFNGIALRGVTLDGIRMQEPEEEHADALGGGCQEEFCPKNGMHLNGIALHDIRLDSAQIHEPDEEELRNCQCDGICPKNGTLLSGVALKGAPLEGIRLQEAEIGCCGPRRLPRMGLWDERHTA